MGRGRKAARAKMVEERVAEQSGLSQEAWLKFRADMDLGAFVSKREADLKREAKLMKRAERLTAILERAEQLAARVRERAEVWTTVKAKQRIRRPPGFKLLGIAEFFSPPETYANVFEPVIRDFQDEQLKALAKNRPWKASFVQVRGYASFWSAVSAQISSSLVKVLKKAIGMATSNPS